MAAQDAAQDPEREPGLVEVEGLDLAAHDHPLDEPLRLEIGRRLQEDPAEHFQVRHGDHQRAARHEDARGLLERRREFVLVSEVLVDVRGVDLRHAAVLEHREVRAAADHVDAGLVLHVDDGPARLGLPAAEVEAEVLLAGVRGAGFAHRSVPWVRRHRSAMRITPRAALRGSTTSPRRSWAGRARRARPRCTSGSGGARPPQAWPAPSAAARSRSCRCARASR